VRLEGPCALALLPRMPSAEVRLGERTIPARLSFPDPHRYVVEFDAPEVAGDGAVEMSLTFDAHFVPRELGMNDDGRELVVLAPSKVELHRSAQAAPTTRAAAPGVR
jgi:hypothetical protein